MGRILERTGRQYGQHAVGNSLVNDNRQLCDEMSTDHVISRSLKSGILPNEVGDGLAQEATFD